MPSYRQDSCSSESDSMADFPCDGLLRDDIHRSMKQAWKKDVMYHLGISSECKEVQAFKDVKVVCMQGSAKRAREFADRLIDYLGIDLPLGVTLRPLFKTERFEIYKVGPVISASHGMGMPSISILLHEITKLLQYAGAKNVLYMRIGTSGGVGLSGGNVVVASEALTSEMRPVLRRVVLGREVERHCHFNAQIVRFAHEAVTQSIEQTMTREIPVVMGRTLGVNDFFEEQGRVDGAIVEHTEDEKMAWLHKLSTLGVKNIEMEAPEFAAFTHHLSIPAVVMCVTLLDRTKGDQVDVPPEVLASYSHILFDAALRVVKRAVTEGIPAMPNGSRLEETL